MSTFKIGDRVVEFRNAERSYDQWSGIVIRVYQVGGVEALEIKANSGSNWNDYAHSFVLEDLYNSPLWRALK